MIKVIEFIFRMLVLTTFGMLTMFGLIFCALLLWDWRYIEYSSKVSDMLVYGEEQD